MTVRLALLLIVVAPLACGESTIVDAAAGSESSTMKGGEPEPGTTSSGGETTADTLGFLGKPDVASPYGCDTGLQDCPAGHKCNPYASDGYNYWDKARCVPVVEEPDLVGEPCTALGGVATGLDTCELGAWCLNVDRDTLVGECFAFCVGERPNLLCEDPELRCGGHRRFPTCLEQCCPIEQDCEQPGHACYWEDHGFYCLPNAAPDSLYADACEFLNVCPAGTYCANPEIGLDCPDGANGCCLPFCALGSDDCAAFNPGYACLPWFEEGETPPGYELTGYCSAVTD